VIDSPLDTRSERPVILATARGSTYAGILLDITATAARIAITGHADEVVTPIARTFGPWRRGTCLVTLGRSASDPFVARMFGQSSKPVVDEIPEGAVCELVVDFHGRLSDLQLSLLTQDVRERVRR